MGFDMESPWNKIPEHIVLQNGEIKMKESRILKEIRETMKDFEKLESIQEGKKEERERILKILEKFDF